MKLFNIFNWLINSRRINCELLKKIKDEYKINGKFTPYYYYNKYIDRLHIYIKDEHYHVENINKNIQLQISQESGEIVGINVSNLREILK